MENLIEVQIAQLEEAHYHILYWVAIGEDKKLKYNFTNVFDDLKQQGITRTKQNAITYVHMLKVLCFIEIREESNRKNLYITHYGAKALQKISKQKKYKKLKSNYLEEV